ncbi:hypothetical protein DYB26_008707 [Aphanomyces astaci]|uniref:Carboxypeptidase n=1 Tax=Aphanomyces astaci TaxID=112090 RepID=A0A3R7EQG4_APHAT|nr:hypothetical protein DYB26_008707 [Aphanomyces astaci]
MAGYASISLRDESTPLTPRGRTKQAASSSSYKLLLGLVGGLCFVVGSTHLLAPLALTYPSTVSNLHKSPTESASSSIHLHHPERKVTKKPNATDDDDELFCGIARQKSGYIKLPHKEDAHYFYWFFESRRNSNTDPLVLWLTGGPGCSSMMALLHENGPCVIDKDLRTQLNPLSWNNIANMLWLDQPTGVGFSYGASEDFDSNEDQVGENIWNFLQGWLRENPSFIGRDFFIVGESYGGHFVPAAAHSIYTQNKLSKGLHIPLQGIAIGNGLTDPLVQYAHATDMTTNAYNLTLVSDKQRDEMNALVPECIRLIASCQNDSNVCDDALGFCHGNLVTPLFTTTSRNPYDIRLDCPGQQGVGCYDFSYIEAFLNSPGTMAKLGVNTDRVPVWKECNFDINQQFSLDWMKVYSQLVPPLLEDGIRVLIYAGDADLMVNWQGNEAWTLALPWSGQREFKRATEKPTLFQGKQVGYSRSYENLAFLRVFNAGHMVPMDQPEVALAIVDSFLRNEEL